MVWQDTTQACRVEGRCWGWCWRQQHAWVHFQAFQSSAQTGGGDHVMTDGNVLLQQHELVMKQLISGRGATNPLFQLPSDSSAVNKKLMS